MLQKEPSVRISIVDALNHPWFTSLTAAAPHHQDESSQAMDFRRICQKLKEFRAPQRL